MVRSVVVGLLLAVAAGAAPYSSLYFFGDSLSDTGNVHETTGFLNSITLGLFPIQPASPPYFDGRFSNGPLWNERVAERLGHPDAAEPAGMSLGIFGSRSGSGNNYAVGGARTGMGGALGGILDDLVPTGIAAQTQFYLSENGGTADPNALYFLLGGGNDLRDAAALTNSAERTASAVASASNLALSIQRLYAAGARNFMLINGPNIGLVPESIAAGRIESGSQASYVFNYVLDQYRTALNTVPGMNLMSFDLYGLYQQLVLDTIGGGSTYGFNSLSPCINNAGACETSLFFDHVHPTARVHRLFGDRIAEQLLAARSVRTLAPQTDLSEAATPEPSTAIVGIVVAGFIGWRRSSRRPSQRAA